MVHFAESFKSHFSSIGIITPTSYLQRLDKLFDTVDTDQIMEYSIYIAGAEVRTDAPLRVFYSSSAPSKNGCHVNLSYLNVQKEIVHSLEYMPNFTYSGTLTIGGVVLTIYIDEESLSSYRANFASDLSAGKYVTPKVFYQENLVKLWNDNSMIQSNWATSTYFGRGELYWPGGSNWNISIDTMMQNLQSIQKEKRPTPDSPDGPNNWPILGAAVPYNWIIANYGCRANWLQATGYSLEGKLTPGSPELINLRTNLKKQFGMTHAQIENVDKPCFLIRKKPLSQSELKLSNAMLKDVGLWQKNGHHGGGDGCLGKSAEIVWSPEGPLPSKMKEFDYACTHTTCGVNAKTVRWRKPVGKVGSAARQVAGCTSKQEQPSKQDGEVDNCWDSQYLNCQTFAGKCQAAPCKYNSKSSSEYASDTPPAAGCSRDDVVDLSTAWSCFHAATKTKSDTPIYSNYDDSMPHTTAKTDDKIGFVIGGYEGCGGDCVIDLSGGGTGYDCINGCDGIGAFTGLSKSDGSGWWLGPGRSHGNIDVLGSNCPGYNFLTNNMSPGTYDISAGFYTGGATKPFLPRSTTYDNRNISFKNLYDGGSNPVMGSRGGSWPPSIYFMDQSGKIDPPNYLKTNWCNGHPGMHMDFFLGSESEMSDASLENVSVYEYKRTSCAIAGIWPPARKAKTDECEGGGGNNPLCNPFVNATTGGGGTGNICQSTRNKAMYSKARPAAQGGYTPTTCPTISYEIFVMQGTGHRQPSGKGEMSFYTVSNETQGTSTSDGTWLPPICNILNQAGPSNDGSCCFKGTDGETNLTNRVLLPLLQVVDDAEKITFGFGDCACPGALSQNPWDPDTDAPSVQPETIMKNGVLQVTYTTTDIMTLTDSCFAVGHQMKICPLPKNEDTWCSGDVGSTDRYSWCQKVYTGSKTIPGTGAPNCTNPKAFCVEGSLKGGDSNISLTQCALDEFGMTMEVCKTSEVNSGKDKFCYCGPPNNSCEELLKWKYLDKSILPSHNPRPMTMSDFSAMIYKASDSMTNKGQCFRMDKKAGTDQIDTHGGKADLSACWPHDSCPGYIKENGDTQWYTLPPQPSEECTMDFNSSEYLCWLGKSPAPTPPTPPTPKPTPPVPSCPKPCTTHALCHEKYDKGNVCVNTEGECTATSFPGRKCTDPKYPTKCKCI